VFFCTGLLGDDGQPAPIPTHTSAENARPSHWTHVPLVDQGGHVLDGRARGGGAEAHGWRVRWRFAGSVVVEKKVMMMQQRGWTWSTCAAWNKSRRVCVCVGWGFRSIESPPPPPLMESNRSKRKDESTATSRDGPFPLQHTGVRWAVLANAESRVRRGGCTCERDRKKLLRVRR
jgi:hypothetical protein